MIIFELHKAFHSFQTYADGIVRELLKVYTKRFAFQMTGFEFQVINSPVNDKNKHRLVLFFGKVHSRTYIEAIY